MLSAGKPLPWVADQLGHVGVRKIDEVYGRWTRNMRHKTSAAEAAIESL
jgi:hypothetical protein